MSVGDFRILNMHNHVLADLVGTRGLKLATRAAQHDSALLDGELCMADAAIRSPSTQALHETEGDTEPFDRLRHVFVD